MAAIRLPVRRNFCGAVEAEAEVAQLFDGTGGRLEAFECEVELIAIRDLREQPANRRGLVSFEDEIAEGVKVAEALGHLLPFDEQEAGVEPVAGELLAG